MQAIHHRFLIFPQLPPPSKLLYTAASAVPPRRHSTATSSAATSVPNLPSLDLPGTAADAFLDYQLLFSSQRAESSDPLPLAAGEGAVPADFPCGTYYLIGPGMTTDDRGSTVSPLDGHGYLRAFRFGPGGEVSYSARYVDTEAAREDRSEGEWRFVRPGFFSMLKARRAAGPTAAKNVANTTVLSWGGRLFCLWEGGHPHEIEPSSLATVGPADLTAEAERPWGCRGGVDIPAGFMKSFLFRILGMPPKRVLSHYKIDAQRNRLLVLSCDAEDMFLHQSNITFYEFDSNFELKQKKEFLITDQIMTHDWAFTDSHYILMANRIKLNLPGSLLAVAGLAPMASIVSSNPSHPTTPIYLLPRFSDESNMKRDWRTPIEAPSQLWTTHVGNAFEKKDGAGNVEIQIQASVGSYQWFNFHKMFGYDWQSTELDPSFMNVGKQAMTHMVQISIALDAEGSCRGCSVANSSSELSNTTDFPVINPIKSGLSNRFIYASSTSGSRKFLPHFPFDTVVKLNCINGVVKSWRPGNRSFIGEPMFISKGTTDEEDGYIIIVEYAVSKKRCYLVVLDAKRIGFDDAVIAKLKVPKHLTFPLGFHGFWDGN